jgi:hypothetical protein
VVVVPDGGAFEPEGAPAGGVPPFVPLPIPGQLPEPLFAVPPLPGAPAGGAGRPEVVLVVEVVLVDWVLVDELPLAALATAAPPPAIAAVIATAAAVFANLFDIGPSLG